jgi:glycosyltransferase involved in cell wall biosynthesis
MRSNRSTIEQAEVVSRGITVAVLLPNLNHARFLPTALDALAAQTRPPDEIVLIDDSSTDDSLAVIDSFAARLPGLRVIRNGETVGVNRATNQALALARSSHVICTAADDRLEPRFIERLTEMLARHPGVPVCVSQYVEYDETADRMIRHDVGSELGCWYAPEGPRCFSPAETRALFDQSFLWLPVNTALIEREAMLSVGGFDAGLMWHSDWFAIYSIALRHGFCVVPEPLSIFRRARSSFSGVGMRDPRAQKRVCMAIHDKLAQPEFRDVYDAVMRHPAVMSSFVRPLLLGLALRPAAWPFWIRLLRWWLGEVGHGRRPGFLRDMIAARRATNKNK